MERTPFQNAWDKLMKEYEKRLAWLKTDYDRGVANLQAWYDSEYQQLVATHIPALEKVESVIVDLDR